MDNLENIRIKDFSNLNRQPNIPILFNIKSKINTIKPLRYRKMDTDKTRHFTPASQEWHNSIYTYDSHYIKTLPSADKNLMNLLNSYFNFQINQNLLDSKTNRPPIRLRRRSTKKVFIGKGDLKHTNSKVIITFYVLNTEGMFLTENYKRAIEEILFPRIKLEKFVNYGRDKKPIITYNRPFTWKEFKVFGDHAKAYQLYLKDLVNKIESTSFPLNLDNLKALDTSKEELDYLVEAGILRYDDKNEIFINTVNEWKPLGVLNFKEFKSESVIYYKNKKVRYFHLLLRLNKLKFTNLFMSKLITLVRKLYNKDVVFNIVKLNKMHLNSDIYNQAVSLKLRDRNNKLYNVLKTSLRKIHLPVISKIGERIPKPLKDDYLVNWIRNNNISSMFADDHAKDPFNNLLLKFYPAAGDSIEINVKKISSIKKEKYSLKDFVLKNLKHLKLRGVRVEAKGRLTPRATASRSVFKMKWKGGLKNVESSFRGWSAIMLRGYLKSNLQYTAINSKNRNGAYGVKTWVSSK